MADRGSLRPLLVLAMILLTLSLGALPHVSTPAYVIAYAVVMGIAPCDDVVAPARTGTAPDIRTESQGPTSPAMDLGADVTTLTPPLRSSLTVPLTHDGAMTAVLSFYASTPNAFTDDHARRCQRWTPGRSPLRSRAGWRSASCGC